MVNKARKLLDRISEISFSDFKKKLLELVEDESARKRVLKHHYFHKKAFGSVFYESDSVALATSLHKSSWDTASGRRSGEVFTSKQKFKAGLGIISKSQLEKGTGITIPVGSEKSHSGTLKTVNLIKLSKGNTSDYLKVIKFLKSYAQSKGSDHEAKAVVPSRITTIYPDIKYKQGGDELRFSIFQVFSGQMPE